MVKITDARLLINEIRKKHPALAKKERTSELAAIRIFCLCCMGDDANEVKNCTATEETCPFWIRRFGKNPYKKRKLTKEQKETMKKRLKKAREKNVSEK